MADQDTAEVKPDESGLPPLPSLEEMQHWTFVMGRAQQLMLEHVAEQMKEGAGTVFDPGKAAVRWPGMEMFTDPAKIAQMQTELWTEGLNIWQRALGGSSAEKTPLQAGAAGRKPSCASRRSNSSTPWRHPTSPQPIRWSSSGRWRPAARICSRGWSTCCATCARGS